MIIRSLCNRLFDFAKTNNRFFTIHHILIPKKYDKKYFFCYFSLIPHIQKDIGYVLLAFGIQ